MFTRTVRDRLCGANKVGLCFVSIIALGASAGAQGGSQAGPQACVHPPSGLRAWWSGDGNAKDILGRSNGTFQGNTGFAAGKVGQGFNFDGNSVVLVPDNPALDFAQELTVELWFQYRNIDDWRGLIGKRAAAADEEPHTTNFGINVNANLFGLGVYFDDPDATGGDDFDIDGSSLEASRLQPPPSVGEFHHFAGTYRQISATQLEVRMFVDGQLVKSRLLPGNLANTVNDIPVVIGASSTDGEFFQGILDEVTLYSRALSATQIARIFAAGSAGKCKADADEDGIGDRSDRCPLSDLSATVAIGDCDSGVANPLLPSGCTISDLIETCSRQARACVSHVTHDLRKSGVITGRQEVAVQHCSRGRSSKK
jgi:hypothetical protein